MHQQQILKLILATSVNGTAGATAAAGTGYTLDGIGFQITRYDMPRSYTDDVTSVLEGGAVFKLYYPNYSTFLGSAQSLPKPSMALLSLLSLLTVLINILEFASP